MNDQAATAKPESAIRQTLESIVEWAQSFLADGGDLESVEKMIDLQKQVDSKQAQKAYMVAMARFKTKPIRIAKDKNNNEYDSKYTSIGNLVNSVLPTMGECGLSHKWEIDQSDPKEVKVICIVAHSDSHSESVVMSAPPDESGEKNPIQQIKSTITYLRSATFEGIMGLASSDANFDDDGAAHKVQYITEKQLSQIVGMVKSTKTTETAFLKFIKSETYESIPAASLGKAISFLKARAVK